MFWIALELSIPEVGLNIMLSLTVKKLDAFKFDGVAESDVFSRRRLTKFCMEVTVYPFWSTLF